MTTFEGSVIGVNNVVVYVITIPPEMVLCWPLVLSKTYFLMQDPIFLSCEPLGKPRKNGVKPWKIAGKLETFSGLTIYDQISIAVTYQGFDIWQWKLRYMAEKGSDFVQAF